MTATAFALTSCWHLDAPVERVWAALSEPAAWPRWWPYVRRVQTLRAGGPDGLGAVRRIEWATRLPYAIVIDVESIESRPHERLRARASGQLVGEGAWHLQPEAGGTRVVYEWRVDVAARWMRALAPLLRPVFRWNHAGVMRAGEAGLRRHLALPTHRRDTAASNPG